MSSPPGAQAEGGLDMHRGATDPTTITTQPPAKVMQRVKVLLQDMGVVIDEESAYRYRCVRMRKGDSEERSPSPPANVEPSPSNGEGPGGADADENLNSKNAKSTESPTRPGGRRESVVLYGSPTEDSADEVRFTVELTRLAGLSDTYSLDVRRLRGNLKSYKFMYDTIRERAELNPPSFTE